MGATVVACQGLHAQTAGLLADFGRFSFEVAAIKPSKDSTPTSLGEGSPGRFEATGVTVVNLLRASFGGTQGSLPAARIAGGPAWMSQNRWDVTAKIPEGNGPGGIQMMLKMVQTLLRDRFKLQVHTEQRPEPVFELVLDKPQQTRAGTKPGTSLTRSEVDCDAMLSKEGAVNQFPQGFWCGVRFERGNPYFLKARGITMGELGRRLQTFGGLDRSVVDHTGLSGTWDFELRFAPDTPAPALEATEPSQAPDIRTAIREQLGVKLESARGAIEVLVIDNVSRPETD